MNCRRSLALGCALAVMVLGVAGQGVAGDEDPSAAVIEGLVSTLPGGVVSIKADPTLSNGRLVLRVVAFNKGAAPVTLNAADIKLYTSANQPVALLPLDQLIA
ncbi:MAG TPA: hypothetical protein VN158_07050, partial [Caulobacter sp.]|nr:hypothetical protein [Caulobacter sp.]